MEVAMFAAVVTVDVLRTRQAAFAVKFDLSLDQYLKIVRACDSTEAITVLELLRASKFRSVYREQSAMKIRKWVDDSNSVGKPLNVWEFKRCAPTWRITYALPNAC